jgi:hypothetical protein
MELVGPTLQCSCAHCEVSGFFLPSKPERRGLNHAGTRISKYVEVM